MALRDIRIMGDPILEKISKPVKVMTLRTETLIQDMLDTMYENLGVGLAAPQVGILKRIVVIDVSMEEPDPIILINPEVIEADGEQTGEEGCLSLPGKSGKVTRANHVKVRALNMNMEPIEVEGEGLLARALLHECDHLDGKLFPSLVEGELHDVSDMEEEEDASEEEE